MNSKDQRHKILEIIEDESIKPTPRWVFTLKTTGGWISFLLAVFMGGLAFSVILYAIQQSDFSLTDHITHSGMELFLSLLPIIWLIFMGLFFIISLIGIRYSWKSYKIPVVKQAGWSVGLSVVIGTLFFIAGGGSWLDNTFGNAMTSYESIEERKIQIWSNPQEGYLSGIIKDVGEEELTITDFDNQAWTIDFNDSWVAGPVLLEIGEKIKVVGASTESFKFKAEEIRPWGGRQRMGKNRIK